MQKNVKNVMSTLPTVHHHSNCHYYVVCINFINNSGILIILILILSTIFIVLSSMTPAICELTLAYLDESHSASSGCQPDLSTYTLNIHPLPCIITQNTQPWGWYSFTVLRRVEGSRPWHCSQCAAHAQSCISQWFSLKEHRNFCP